MRRRGDVVAWRAVAFGHIRFAMPHVVVAETAEQVVLWLPPGARGKKFAGLPLKDIADLETNDWSLTDKTWTGSGVLKLWRRGDAHSLWHFWDDAHSAFAGWYVNLEEPWRETPRGWDTRDLALDVVVDPDGSWRWKDEDHLAAAAARGWIPPDVARAVRAEGERVVAARPWPTGWEEFAPDPEWPAPALPEGWDVV